MSLLHSPLCSLVRAAGGDHRAACSPNAHRFPWLGWPIKAPVARAEPEPSHNKLNCAIPGAEAKSSDNGRKAPDRKAGGSIPSRRTRLVQLDPVLLPYSSPYIVSINCSRMLTLPRQRMAACSTSWPARRVSLPDQRPIESSVPWGRYGLPCWPTCPLDRCRAIPISVLGDRKAPSTQPRRGAGATRRCRRSSRAD